MKRKLLFSLALLLLFGFRIAGLEPCSTKVAMTVKVDSLKAIDEGMRVYCQVYGHPNTSDRIDAVTINGTAEAFDIDPIEFKRAFQWEEDGVIALEIDFPVKPMKKFTLKFITPRGAVTASYPVK